MEWLSFLAGWTELEPCKTNKFPWGLVQDLFPDLINGHVPGPVENNPETGSARGAVAKPRRSCRRTLTHFHILSPGEAGDVVRGQGTHDACFASENSFSTCHEVSIDLSMWLMSTLIA